MYSSKRTKTRNTLPSFILNLHDSLLNFAFYMRISRFCYRRLGTMPEIEFGMHTVRSHGAKVAKKHKCDWLILLVLVAMDGFLNYIQPFNRYTNSKMLEDLKFPFKEHDTIPMWAVPIFAIILPCTVFLIYYHYRRDVYDLHHAILGILYSVLVTAVITDSIKDAVGRPRPNFFYRCFPDGIEAFQPNGDVNCHGDPKVVKEGYKSFPSGHTSWSFAGLAFLSWYLCGKVKAFDRRGHAAKLCIVLLPLLFAALVGISRIDDYWHHWTDVFTGSIIGSVVASLCYLLFFPFPHDINGWAPHASIKMRENIELHSTSIGIDIV
ncbi:probable lipid phosphate phosphatase 4 isoform X3 [Solanum verrucosum]|uniref:probable lipid phosphate phosphatase 4 isoform X2 n=1 Tax=Solanum verrucosum TaxID=315347 RepID=UPI0020D17999|nr:probable lipid phosphate phosphatase 4 isoform X2 [Solanum verrucosum]XP_049357023.1 probable lipid phosphate phosphatase 4 isoform X3 [Solanum verrucosum]